MKERLRFFQYHPALWIGFSVAVLVAEFFAGPFISFPILFVVPVAMAAAGRKGRKWAITLALVLPLIRLTFSFLWANPPHVADSVINTIIRMTVLVLIAVLIDRVTTQASHIKVLSGLLPICAFCKKIRTEKSGWQPIETYISRHSDATFSHGFCPDCGRKHYGDFLDDGRRN